MNLCRPLPVRCAQRQISYTSFRRTSTSVKIAGRPSSQRRAFTADRFGDQDKLLNLNDGLFPDFRDVGVTPGPEARSAKGEATIALDGIAPHVPVDLLWDDEDCRSATASVATGLSTLHLNPKNESLNVLLNRERGETKPSSRLHDLFCPVHSYHHRIKPGYWQ